MKALGCNGARDHALRKRAVDAKEFELPSAQAVDQGAADGGQPGQNLAEPFDPTRYTDEYRANLMKVIKAKMKGKKVKLEEPEGEAHDSDVLDLMSRLRASLEEGAGKKGSVRAKRKSVAASRKPRAKKKTA